MLERINRAAEFFATPILMMSESWKFVRCPIIISTTTVMWVLYLIMTFSSSPPDELGWILVLGGGGYLFLCVVFTYGCAGLEWLMQNRYDGGLLTGTSIFFGTVFMFLGWCRTCMAYRNFFAAFGLLWIAIAVPLWFIIGLITTSSWAVYESTNIFLKAKRGVSRSDKETSSR